MTALTHPVLVLVRGLPGSGKSYIANKLQEQLQAKYGTDSTVMLDPDAINYESSEYTALVAELTAQGVDPKFYPYRSLRGRAHAGITSNKVIIWNQPFTNFDGFNKTVINLSAHAEEHHTTLPILVVEVMTNPAVAKQRVVQRKKAGGHGPSDATFERFEREYQSFADKGFTTITVDGEDQVTKSVDAIMQAVAPLE